MSPATLFRDILAYWPLMCLVFTKEGDRSHRTHVHRHPHDHDRFALVRFDQGAILNIAHVTRAELDAICALGAEPVGLVRGRQEAEIVALSL